MFYKIIIVGELDSKGDIERLYDNLRGETWDSEAKTALEINGEIVYDD